MTAFWRGLIMIKIMMILKIMMMEKDKYQGKELEV